MSFKSYLTKINSSDLIKFLYDYISKSNKTIIPDIFINKVNISGDGACQLRSIANNVNNFLKNPDSASKQKEMAAKMYEIIKNTVTDVLPKLTNKQLVNDWGFVHIDFSLTPIENINALIEISHGPYIKNLEEYSEKFKYGTYTTNFELKILLSKNLESFWSSEFEIPVPCVIIYIHKNGFYQEIECNNGSFKEFILFRINYINSNHYESLYLKNQFYSVSELLIQKACNTLN